MSGSSRTSARLQTVDRSVASNLAWPVVPLNAPAHLRLHVAWTQFQRRQKSMEALAGFESLFMERRQTQSLLATAADYRRLFQETMGVLRDRRPAVLWIQLPPVPLLWAALRHRLRQDPAMRLVADCHNATFGDRWGNVPFALRLIDKCDLVLVHNEDMRSVALRRGIGEHRLFVLEDVPPLIREASPAQLPACMSQRPRPWILFPGSFGHDEPIRELLQTASRLPAYTFVLTGRSANALRYGHDLAGLPENVVIPDYLDTPVFDRLLQESDLVLALTREDGIQLSACNEALGFGKAMVVSDTPLLRRLFAEGARMADSTRSAALCRAIEDALGRRRELEIAARALAEKRRRQWGERIEEGPEWLWPNR